MKGPGVTDVSDLVCVVFVVKRSVGDGLYTAVVAAMNGMTYTVLKEG